MSFAFALLQNLIFISFICIFHASEYIISKKFHPESTNIHSLLVTLPFLFAFSFGLAEYWIEYYLYSEIKGSYKQAFIWIGLIMILFGLSIRICAEYTAGKAFTHYMATFKTNEHPLITTGIYSIFRHPGYFGMFVFSIGSQIFFTNPISSVVFTAVLWKFFSDRIKIEEKLLVQFFRSDYTNYRSKTPTSIPFID